VGQNIYDMKVITDGTVHHDAGAEEKWREPELSTRNFPFLDDCSLFNSWTAGTIVVSIQQDLVGE
jgi:hypothetical protein